MIVVDASVAVKWYVQEKGSAEADAILCGEQRPVAPELVRMEVISALCNQVRLHGKREEHIRALCARWAADLEDMSVRLYDQAGLMEPAWNMALAFRHPVQDCVYLALAEQHGWPLVTADAIFLEKVGQAFPRVHLLPGLGPD